MLSVWSFQNSSLDDEDINGTFGTARLDTLQRYKSNFKLVEFRGALRPMRGPALWDAISESLEGVTWPSELTGFVRTLHFISFRINFQSRKGGNTCSP